MRYFSFCSLLLLQLVTKVQLLYPYRDTTCNYYIGLPEKWRYWAITDKPNISMMAKDASPVTDAEIAFIYLEMATSQTRLQ